MLVCSREREKVGERERGRERDRERKREREKEREGKRERERGKERGVRKRGEKVRVGECVCSFLSCSKNIGRSVR